MSKLLNGKKWLTVSDAATYMSSAIGETVCDADIFQLATEGSLTLSVHILDREHAEIGEIVDKIDVEEYPHNLLNGLWKKKRQGYIRGTWDLLNEGGCKELLEKKYHSLKGDYYNAQVTGNWIFLNRSDGSVCKLLSLENYDEQEVFVSASSFPEEFQFILLRDRIDKLVNHLNRNNQPHSTANSLSEREKNSHLNLISALLRVVLGKDGVVPHPSFDSEAKLINHISDIYADCGEGLAKSTLEKRFSEAKKTLLF